MVINPLYRYRFDCNGYPLVPRCRFDCSGYPLVPRCRFDCSGYPLYAGLTVMVINPLYRYRFDCNGYPLVPRCRFDCSGYPLYAGLTVMVYIDAGLTVMVIIWSCYWTVKKDTYNSNDGLWRWSVAGSFILPVWYDRLLWAPVSTLSNHVIASFSQHGGQSATSDNACSLNTAPVENISSFVIPVCVCSKGHPPHFSCLSMNMSSIYRIVGSKRCPVCIWSGFVVKSLTRWLYIAPK